MLRRAADKISEALQKLSGGRLSQNVCEELANEALITVSDEVYKAGSGLGKHYRANKSMIAIADQISKQQGAACRAGCSHCCKSEKITITGNEARTIKENFESLSPSIKHAVLANISTYKSTGAPDDPTRSPCVFLVNDRCSIHSFRPSLCWAYLSKNEALCAARLMNGGGRTHILEKTQALYLAFLHFYPLSTTHDADLRGSLFEVNSVMKYLFTDGGNVEDLAPTSPARSLKQIPISLL